MKLSTRLALVVSAILAFTTIISSAQSVIVHRNEKLATYSDVLNNLANQLASSDENDLTFALFIAEQSPIPMSLAYISPDGHATYLTEAAGSGLVIPTKEQYRKGLKEPILFRDIMERFYKIGKNEYIGFYVSITDLNDEINRSFKKILFFNLIIILFAGLLITFIFRRDSKLNSAAKGMQEFIGDASHELKTPLTVIRGYSEILSNNPEQGEKYARRIHDESIRMSGIIDQLLKIAALDEGHNEEPISIDIAEYLKSHIEDILMLQPSRRVSFVAEPLMVKAPYDLVDTLLSNVLTNARIHSPEDAPLLISIAGKQVTIEDGGPGMQEIPDKPFKRFDSSRSRKTGGSGLGMSLIQKCAKELGAKLNFGKSELGGLKVEITF